MTYTRVYGRDGTLRTDCVRRDADGANIPKDDGNYDWQTYVEWCAGHVATVPPPTPPAVYVVSKLTVIRRLNAAGRFTAAVTVLRSNTLLYEMWSAVSELRSDDTQARALFAAVGADPNEILAPEA